MVARLLSLGILLGLLSLAVLVLSPWPGPQAAQAGTPGLFAQVDRAPRPAASHGGLRRSSPPSWRPRTSASPLHGAERAGSRKAVPVTRGQELGLRFRPDDNASPYAQPGFAPTDPARPGLDALQSQFRPIPKRRKPTYEELQSEMAPAPQPGVAPMMPYPLGAPPLPGYGPYPPPL